MTFTLPRVRSWISATALLAALSAGPAQSIQPADLMQDFPRTQLIVSTRTAGCILFDVYVARTQEHRARGLMFVRAMDEYEGMIFSYPQATEISMWMKNTLIPLDMLFIAADGTIASLALNTTPESTAIISSNALVNGVLELNAGSSQHFGIQTGDRIIFPAG